MIVIDNVIVSDQVVDEKFVCDLNHCKGGCCVDGDAGAPLLDEELTALNEYFETIKPYLDREGLMVIEDQGRYVYDKSFGWVTPTIQHKPLLQICHLKGLVSVINTQLHPHGLSPTTISKGMHN